ncbi:hypothetical protein [Nostoc sp. FACHB-145]|uniref:hypothetical protein n=1 Tax=Nostoc sp. FACHB-145 TaxID=2692836 RepID=UPI0016853C9B|nr:hypothetical protein [Nostoc sp. FACHB-145]MBD2472367.1 hypothetical protein [Nostoc sp. FACHB-145]
MRGEFIEVWSESWREIWSKLARHTKAPDDLFSELYRELITVIIVPPNQTDKEKASAEMRFAEIVSDPAQARKTFMKTKSRDLRGERLIVKFFESAYDVLEDLGGDLLANRYFNLVSAFIDKYSLRYNLRKPCCLSPTLPGIFANLIRELKIVTSKDAHLNTLMKDFEDAICDLRIDCSNSRIKTCIHKQFMLLEAMGSKYLNKDQQTLGDICNKIDLPHSALKEALSKIYGFASNYPGIRHGGNPKSVIREIEMRDMVVMSILLAGFAPYLTDQINADVVYRGEL